jgi:hypothetical protein
MGVPGELHLYNMWKQLIEQRFRYFVYFDQPRMAQKRDWFVWVGSQN